MVFSQKEGYSRFLANQKSRYFIHVSSVNELPCLCKKKLWKIEHKPLILRGIKKHLFCHQKGEVVV